ncbi:AAA domain [Rhizoctonia solani]|uniref:AAA domain n=1 Tax=Rhizoctonia solani TaxID=456999 RepID=A0A8H7M7B6_9AGAM|nr:AAA domain [Rhizoctonia solani]
MDPSNSTNSNILIVLCGLVGSGKSTFATALQREFPEVRRCNQDELGRREDVEREVHAALSQGLSVCVDRTNFDPGQRRTWIDIARQHSNIEIWGITMDTPFDVVLSRFSYQFVPISANEGFNRVYRIAPRENPDYTREELENILAAIRESPYAPFQMHYHRLLGARKTAAGEAISLLVGPQQDLSSATGGFKGRHRRIHIEDTGTVAGAGVEDGGERESNYSSGYVHHGGSGAYPEGVHRNLVSNTSSTYPIFPQLRPEPT